MTRIHHRTVSQTWRAVAIGAVIAAGAMLLVGVAFGGPWASAVEASSADSVPAAHRQSGRLAPGIVPGAVPVGQFAPGATAPTWKGAVTLKRCQRSVSDTAVGAGIAIDRMGNMWVSDHYGDCIHEINPDGYVPAVTESTATSGAIVVSANGRQYVAESGRIRVVAENGKFVGYIEPSGKSTSSSWASSLAVGPDYSIWLTDSEQNRVENWSADGRFLKAWGGFGTLGPTFRYPAGIAVDQAGNVYVVETVGHQVQKLAPDGTVITAWGRGGARPGEFLFPASIAIDGSGSVYIADGAGDRVQKFTSGGDFLACWGDACTGVSSMSRWVTRFGIAVDRVGAIYVPTEGTVRRFLPLEAVAIPPDVAGPPRFVVTDNLNRDEFWSLATPPAAATKSLPTGTIEAVRAEVVSWGGYLEDAKWFTLNGDNLSGPVIVAWSQTATARMGNGGCADYLAWSITAGRTVWQGHGCRDSFSRIEGDNGFAIASPVWLPQEPHCCNSLEITRGYVWDGGTFANRGSAVSELPRQ